MTELRPASVTRRHVREPLLALAAALAAAAYVPLNVPHGTAHDLLGPLERRLPIVPVLAIPYLVLLPVFWALVVRGLVRPSGDPRVRRSFRALLVASLVAFVVSDLVFLVSPTVVPRPGAVGGFMAGMLRLIYEHDNRFNDLPSLHAAMATLVIVHARSFRSGLARWAAVMLALTALAATLLLRQHSVAGAGAGVALAGCAWWWAMRRTRAGD